MYRCTCEENTCKHAIICLQHSFALVAIGVEERIPTSDHIFAAKLKEEKNTTLSVLTLPTLIHTNV